MTPTPAPSPWRAGHRGDGLRRWLHREALPMICLLALLLVARSSLANHYYVPSGSMEPALAPGDRVVVDMRAYGLRVPFSQLTLWPGDPLAPGDVVVFRSPSDNVRLIKRVVAVAGDRVDLVDGRLAINGMPLARRPGGPEDFGDVQVALNLDDGGGPDLHNVVVPDGQVLVLGDHRGASIDGRYFGFVPAASIYGQARGVFWRSGEGFGWRRL
ncbi:signal peptidase I [Luteimonas sp. 100069]|uniref:signal peptidase I n=1 Tax=Luteimonas sp. 100069 TaxID=2006109 RepID=UPI000F513271|nr:signal peptidase I [Luteimonas sp. 100069]RPD84425.1 signal peptidase I [Luteimonas sp. 100069]